VKRRNRLSRSRDFDAVYRQGRSVAARYLVLYSFPQPDRDREPRLGLAVSRKIGGAVERNRIKRQLREAYDRLASETSQGHDYVLVARAGLAEAASANGFDWLLERVRDVFAEARALETEAR
jgi:ribonuclease P protein component